MIGFRMYAGYLLRAMGQ